MKILLLAYYFPPDSSSGSFRPLFFANHLAELGDEVVVLTARQENFLAAQPVDRNLVAGLDRRVSVLRCAVRRPKESLIVLRNRLMGRSGDAANGQNATQAHAKTAGGIQAFKDFITDLLTTPDDHAGWIPFGIRKGLEIVRGCGWCPDIILATGGPWSTLVMGCLLKRLTGAPLALDFRDPWVTNPDHLRRGGFFRWIDARLERHVVANADLLIANTEELGRDFLWRYPSLSPERMVAITNGFERYMPDIPRENRNTLTLTHVGELYMSRNPRPLLEAARNAIEHRRIDPAEFRIRFVGGIDVDDAAVTALLDSTVLNRSIEVIRRVSYDQALRAMGESDVLILYQPGFPLQIPRKLYDYMSSRRPLLCIAEPQSATWSLVERYLLGSPCENDAVRLEEALVTIYGDWRSGSLKQLADDRCEPFLNRNLALRLRRRLEQTLQSAPAKATGRLGTVKQEKGGCEGYV